MINDDSPKPEQSKPAGPTDPTQASLPTGDSSRQTPASFEPIAIDATGEPFRFSLWQFMSWVTLVAFLMAILRQMPAQEGAFATGLLCLVWLLLLEFTGPHGRSAWVVWWSVVGVYGTVAIISIFRFAK